MRLLALILLGAQVTTTPINVPRHAEWIGAMEFTDSRGLMVGPTKATLDIADSGAVTGRWVSTSANHNSGAIHGTVTPDGKFKVTVTVFGGATVKRPDGTEEPVSQERCNGEGAFTGILFANGVIRLTAKKVEFDSVIKRAQNRECENLTRVVWTLQEHRD